MFCTTQEVVTESGFTARLRKEVANATGCLDMIVMSVVKSFSTLSFTFKISSRSTSAPSRPHINPFDLKRQTQIGYVSLPSRLDHVRMYSNHDGYNALMDFLEKNKLGWTVGIYGDLP